MKRNSVRSSLAYRETFWTGRLGIRGKILIYLTVLAGFMLSLVWLSQTMLLYNIYRSSAMSQMGRVAQLLTQNINHVELASLADRLGEDNDLGVVLLDAEGGTLLSAGRTRFSPLQDLSPEDAAAWIRKAAGKADGSPAVETVTTESHARNRIRQMDFSGDVPEEAFGRQTYVVMAQRVVFDSGEGGTLLLAARGMPIRSTRTAMRNQFAVMVLAVLLATVLVGYTMAQSVSEPIIETNRAARDLSQARYTRPPHSGGYREIWQLNDTLAQTAEDLGKVEDLQRELIANISHDLRTPLTMIEGYAEAMRDIPDENTPENMQIIIDEAKRLSGLVSEVLDFSRLRTGNLEMKKSPFDLAALAEEICGRVSRMSGVEGYTVHVETDGEAPVEADRARISQVIYNLVGNALTYTGEDRTVRVSVTRRGVGFRVSVTDSGEGISKEELPYIWNRYYRSRENHRRSVIGSGLGLNICRGILEAHRVPYGVESEPGKGSTFWFELAENGKDVKNGLDTEKEG